MPVAILGRAANAVCAACRRGPHGVVGHLVALATMMASIVMPVPLRAAADVDEYAVKAAFLYQFTQFVEWPPESFADGNAPIVLAVLGSDPFGESLRRATVGRTGQGRPIVVRYLKPGQPLRPCHILFVSASEEARIPDVLRTVGPASILTVGDSTGFAEAGGMLNFVVDAARVKFEINIGAAERGRVRISSKLLKLATIVDRGRR